MRRFFGWLAGWILIWSGKYKRTGKKEITRLLLAAIVLAGLSLPVMPQHTVKADDWSAWQYYKDIDITGGNTSATDYVLPLTLYAGSGTDNNSQLYLENLAKSDFSDIRFADGSGNSLSYFEENWGTLLAGGIAQPMHPPITDPTAITVGDTTYFVWQSGKPYPQPWISSYNTTTGWITPIQVASDAPAISDDHGPPTIIQSADGYFHVFYGQHQTGALKHTRSSVPNSIVSWSIQSDVTSSAVYPKTLRVGNDIHIFYKVTGTRVIAHRVSIDNGVNWSAASNIITTNATYTIYPGNFVYDSSNSTIHMGWTLYSNTSLKRQNLYEAYFNLSDNHTYATNGTDLGTGIDQSEIDANALIYSNTGTYESNHPVLRLDQNGYPVLMWTSENASGYNHTIISWNGSGWNSAVGIASAKRLHDYQDFTVQSSTNITAYLVRNGITSVSLAAWGGDIEEWNYNGVAWSLSKTVLSQVDSGYPLNSPRLVSSNFLLFAQVDPGNFDWSSLQLYSYISGNLTPILPVASRKYWVKVPSIPQSPATTTIRLYWGNSAASSDSSAPDTFVSFNNGITGNFTADTVNGALFGNNATAKLMTSTETAINRAFAYGKAFNWGDSIYLNDWRDSWGSNGGQVEFGLHDSTSVAALTDTAAVYYPQQRYAIARSNDETATPSDIVISYFDPAGTYYTWNGTGWQTGAAYVWAAQGTIDVSISTTNTTVYSSVTQNGVSIVGNVTGVALADIKPFSTGQIVAIGEYRTNFYYSDVRLSSIFIRPYMNPEPYVSDTLNEMPSVVTGGTTAVVANPQPTATLHGTLSDMGVASDAYIGFQWSQDGGVTWNDTSTIIANAPGNAQVTITGYDPTIPVQYRIFAQVGTVRSYGGTESFIMTGGSGGVYRFLWTGLLLSIAAVLLVFVVVAGMKAKSSPVTVGVGLLIGIIIFAIVRLLMLAIWS